MMSRPHLIVGLSVLALSAIALAQPRANTPRIVYNASASVPIGYYAVMPVSDIERHDLVLVQTPAAVRGLADQRRYLPRDVPMIKGVAALSKDVVCAVGETIAINGQPTVTRQRYDRAGRVMPWWEGCVRLDEDDVFLLNPGAPYSFDGRYFGVVKRSLVIGKVRPL
jgi:conjugative transfer signal peptidase TraF